MSSSGQTQVGNGVSIRELPRRAVREMANGCAAPCAPGPSGSAGSGCHSEPVDVCGVDEFGCVVHEAIATEQDGESTPRGPARRHSRRAFASARAMARQRRRSPASVRVFDSPAPQTKMAALRRPSCLVEGNAGPIPDASMD